MYLQATLRVRQALHVGRSPLHCMLVNILMCIPFGISRPLSCIGDKLRMPVLVSSTSAATLLAIPYLVL
jgi:hypothetical protein